MGNRGCLHDADQRLTGRRWTTRAWITCTTTWTGVRRELMRPGYYTELFFLDEATAFAAGHRPCAECRNDVYKAFKSAFVETQAGIRHKVMTAADMDGVIHQERTRAAKPFAQIDTLPDGAMIDLGGEAWLKLKDQIHHWSPAGYDRRRPVSDIETIVLTPPSIISVLSAGYLVTLHPSAVA